VGIVTHRLSGKAIAVTASREPLIAVIDDDKTVRDGMSDLIEALGYEVARFPSAEEFLTSATLQRLPVVLSDVQMPGMNGPDLQQVLQAEGYRLPIIFMTGYPDEQVRVRTLEAGALAFLTKPVSEDALIALLEKALAPAR
jgi:FixJ family two-component response regulator